MLPSPGKGRIPARSERLSGPCRPSTRSFRDLLAMKQREAGEAHVDKMRRILAANIQNKLGSRRVDAIRVEDVVRCLKPIWHEKPVLAKRAAMFVDQAMTFAKANGYDVDIAAANSKVLSKALGRQKRCVNHFRALDPKDVPGSVCGD